MGDQVKFSIDLERPSGLFVTGVALTGSRIDGEGDDAAESGEFSADSTLQISVLREARDEVVSGDGNGVVLTSPITDDKAVILMLPKKETDDLLEEEAPLNGVYSGLLHSIMRALKDTLAIIDPIRLGRADVLVQGDVDREYTCEGF